MSSWNVEIPASFPATLKSIVPSASSEPKMSVRMIGGSPPPSSSRSIPIATPATACFSGTPAAIIASEPPHTDAIDDDPHDSVIRLSTRIEYEKSSASGSAATSERSARLPWPTSRRPGAPLRPTSPTEKGGKVYWR